jgi:hypothetical protein
MQKLDWISSRGYLFSNGCSKTKHALNLTLERRLIKIKNLVAGARSNLNNLDYKD